jgi:hypothetical protein
MRLQTLPSFFLQRLYPPHISESGAYIRVNCYTAPEKKIVHVAAKTPKAVMLAKTLVQNAVDASDASHANIEHVDSTNNRDGDDVIAAPDAVAMQSNVRRYRLRVPQLRAELKRCGLSSSGDRKTLVLRLAKNTDQKTDVYSRLLFVIPDYAVGSLLGEKGANIHKLQAGK